MVTTTATPPQPGGISQTQFNHTSAALSAVFDDANLVSAAGLVPVMRLAEQAGLTDLAAKHLTVPTDKGANAGAKVSSLVAGMVAGADSIEDMRLLRHGGMRRLFDRVYAPSTLGSFLRSFEFGHVRQLDVNWLGLSSDRFSCQPVGDRSSSALA